MVELKSSVYGRRMLEQSPLFAQMDESSRHDLIGHAIPRSFGAGETVCRIGDPGGSMMAVLAGTVRISMPTVKGKEIILGDLHTGELFGEIALLDGKPRSANATALTKCELLVLERRNVIPFLERNPATCLQLMELLCARIRRSDERMADLAFFELPTRLAKLLLSYGVERAGKEPRISLSQTELAEMVGATRENVNRCLRDWQRRGWVKLQDGWTVISDSEKLRSLISQD
jgi:CRP/FNR family transcriptional regulator, cyclic AMP receptor protein